MQNNFKFVLITILLLSMNNLATQPISAEDRFESEPINIKATISITAPSTNAIWVMGNSYEILWTWSGNIIDVSIRLYLSSSEVLIIADTTSNDGSYTWTIPETLTEGDYYRIQVTSLTSGESAGDYSSYFEISGPRSISVINPTASSVWVLGGQNKIEWTWTGIIDYVILELYKGNALVDTIDTQTTNDGLFYYSLPNDNRINNGMDYKVKISVYEDTAVSDYSEYFSISESISITPTLEKIGYFEIGKTYELTWDSTGIFDYVKIEINDIVIVESTQNDGSYEWLVPNNIQPNLRYKLEFIALVNGRPQLSVRTDYMPVYNEIELGFVSPEINDIVQKGTTYTYIKISARGMIYDNFDIELYKNSIYIDTISSYRITDEKSQYEIYWRIDNALKQGNDYSLKLVHTKYKDISVSSPKFSISEKFNIKFLKPSYGESISIGEKVRIEWESTGLFRNITIELSISNYDTIRIAREIANEDFYEFVLTETLFTGLKSKIGDYQANLNVNIKITINEIDKTYSSRQFNIENPFYTSTNNENSDFQWITFMGSIVIIAITQRITNKYKFHFKKS